MKRKDKYDVTNKIGILKLKLIEISETFSDYLIFQ